MTSSKPYLIRALYEWIADNGLTPYLVINADYPGCLVPQEYVKEGKIVLNIAMQSVNGLVIGNEAIDFKARFSGVPRQIYAPIESVSAIYAKENGQGMVFADEEIHGDEGENGDTDAPPPPPPPPTGKGKPKLKIVK